MFNIWILFIIYLKQFIYVEKKLYHTLFIRKLYVQIVKVFSYRHLSVILFVVSWKEYCMHLSDSLLNISSYIFLYFVWVFFWKVSRRNHCKLWIISSSFVYFQKLKKKEKKEGFLNLFQISWNFRKSSFISEWNIL